MGAPTLRARLLGGLELRLGDRPIPPLDSARAEGLLAYLLLHRDAPQSRQRLAVLIWPDSTEAQARTNLRHVLHTLRRGLPDADRFVDAGPRTLQWRPDAPLWLDVAEFEDAVATGRLEEAAELYTGDLLEGSYDDWLLEERERLAQMHLDVLERLARDLDRPGRRLDAVRYAERLLRLDPLREEAYRLLMRLHAASGDNGRAIRAYHVCAATLQRELGIEPSPATREAYEALLPVPDDAPETEKPESAAPRSPLVGRAEERARLVALWREADQGAARLVLVTGEAGVGKSRLVEELRSWCRRGGAVTAEARAYAAEGAMPYGTVVAWLRSQPIAGRLLRLDHAYLTELARLLPELLAEMPELAAPKPLPEPQLRQRLFDAIVRALLSATSPLLLVADDLQWCDVQSLRFVHYLLRSQPEARLLVAATARREEVDVHSAVSELEAGLESIGRLEEVPLERLSREETATLAEQVARRRLGEAEAARLFDDSEGNPLFIVEAVRAGEPDGGVPKAGDSPRVQAVIAARLAQLSPPAAELVGVAATIGRGFTTQVLADAADVEEGVFVQGLDELWRRGLVRAHGPSAYDFSHGRIREAAYSALSPAKARHHHLRVAEALERAHASDPDAIAAQLAAHHDAAGEPRRAIGWYRRAADAAQLLHANTDSARFLARALALAAELPAGRDRSALELEMLGALPAPLLAVEGYASERLADAHERALELAAELDVELDPPLVRSLALASLSRGDFPAAEAFGEQLRERGERDGDEVLRVEAAYVLGVTAYWVGRLQAAREHLERAVERCRPEQVPVHLLRYGQDPQVLCMTRLAHVLWLLGDAQAARSTCSAGLALSRERGHPYTHGVVTMWAALLAIDDRDEPQLREHAGVLGSGGPAFGVMQYRIPAEAMAGLVEVLDGRPEAGVARVRRILDEVRGGPLPAPGVLAVLLRILLEACRLAGDAERGLAASDEAIGLGFGADLWEAEVRRLRAWFLEALGADAGDVAAELERAIAVAERQGARALERRARDDLAGLQAERS